jgi:hypothetical protein
MRVEKRLPENVIFWVLGHAWFHLVVMMACYTGVVPNLNGLCFLTVSRRPGAKSGRFILKRMTDIIYLLWRIKQ